MKAYHGGSRWPFPGARKEISATGSAPRESIRHGLPQGAAQTIRAAFASQPGYQVSRLIDYQGLENPLFRIARMPHLLEGLGTWLFQHGSKHGISNQQVWWFLLESAEDPIRELVRVYITNPAWQNHFPDAMSPPGWKRLTHWLRERYSLDATGCDYQSHSPLRPIEEFQAVYRSGSLGELVASRC